MKVFMVLCAGMMAAAVPSGAEAGSQQPVQVAERGYSIAGGGCYQPAAYQTRADRAWPGSYGAGYSSANCAGGGCFPSRYSAETAYCPDGQCGYQGGALGTANCPNGQCGLRQQVPPRNYSYPAATRSPGGFYPGQFLGLSNSPRPVYSPQKIDNAYPANFVRPAGSPAYQGSASPFFN